MRSAKRIPLSTLRPAIRSHTMARRKAGPDADHFPWRRKVKRDPGAGKMLAAKRHKTSWCSRCPGATRRWMAGKKPLSENVAEMALVRCPRASTCTKCTLQSALGIIMTLPPDLVMLDNFSRHYKPKHLTGHWNR